MKRPVKTNLLIDSNFQKNKFLLGKIKNRKQFLFHNLNFFTNLN